MRRTVLALAVTSVFLAPALAAEPPAPAPAPVPVPTAAPSQPNETVVFVTVRVVDATPRAARSLRLLTTARRPGDLATVDPAVLERRLRCWERTGQVNFLSTPKLAALPSQRATVSIGEHVSYIQDYDVEISMAEAIIANPVVATVFEGLNVECTATPVAGGVDLAASMSLSDVLDPIRTVETTLSAGDAGKKVRIQVPEVHVRQAEGRLFLAPGRAALLADLPPPMKEPSGRVVLAWIEAHAVVGSVPAKVAPPVAAPAR